MADNLATKLQQYMRTTPGVSGTVRRYMANIPDAQKPRHGNTKDPQFKKAPTGGEWTKKIGYNPKRQEMTINFQSGFQATYPGIDSNTFLSAKRGATTKDGRANSVGAWLHQNPSVMVRYNESPINHGETNLKYGW